MTRLLLAILVSTLLAACAAGSTTSFVAQLQRPADAQILANGMAEFVGSHLPAAASTVVLDPTPSNQARNALTPALASALHRRGFAVAREGQAVTGSVHHVRYVVTELGNGNLVRLTIDGRVQGARFFERNAAGGLQAGGPFTVIQAEGA
jgi:uncharacterized lipoprotein YajG